MGCFRTGVSVDRHLATDSVKPMPLGQWYWEPHGETYALDLTHPEAQGRLREKMRSLAQRGVRYFKPDFIGVPCAGIGYNTYSAKPEPSQDIV